MRRKRWFHVIALTLGLAAVDVVLFSKSLVGLSFTSENILVSALAFTAVAANVLVGGIGYYNLLFKPVEPMKLYKRNELNEPKDYFAALEKAYDKRVFNSYVDRANEQLRRFESKSEALTTLLLQSFSPEEMSFQHFNNVLGSVKKLFLGNLKKMINRIVIFDEEDFEKTSNLLLDNVQNYEDRQRIQSKVEVYNEHIAFVDKMLNDNDDILIKMDKLLLEISKLDGLQDDDFDNLLAVQEINELISNMKYYKQ